MSGIDWVAVAGSSNEDSGLESTLETRTPTTATPICYELVKDRWKIVNFNPIKIKILCEGPYLLKQEEFYYFGNDDVYKRKKGFPIYSYIQSKFKILSERNLAWEKILNLKFSEAQTHLDCIEIFGGEFLGRKEEPKSGRNLQLFDK